MMEARPPRYVCGEDNIIVAPRGNAMDNREAADLLNALDNCHRNDHARCNELVSALEGIVEAARAALAKANGDTQ